MNIRNCPCSSDVPYEVLAFSLPAAERLANGGIVWRFVVHNLGCQRVVIASPLSEHKEEELPLVFCHAEQTAGDETTTVTYITRRHCVARLK